MEQQKLNYALEKLEEIHALEHTLPEYFIDMNYNNVTFYVEEQDWELVRPIYLSFKTNKKVVVKNYIGPEKYIKKDVTNGLFFSDFVA